MVEISHESNNEETTSPSDDKKCHELQLSVLNVHRGLLSPIHPSANHDKEDNLTCHRVKRKERSGSMNGLNENHPCPRDFVPPAPSECTPALHEKSKVAKRRKKTSWRSDQCRKQKNAKGRLSRAEMPYDQLLKLREKERVAQQQRRQRLKKSEAKNIQVHRERLKKFCLIKSAEANGDTKYTIKKVDNEDQDNEKDKDRIKPEKIEDKGIENTNTGKLKSFVDLKKEITESKSKPITDEEKPKASLEYQKITFMYALGLAHTKTTNTNEPSFHATYENMHPKQALENQRNPDREKSCAEMKNNKARNMSVSSTEEFRPEWHASDESVSSMDFDDYDDDDGVFESGDGESAMHRFKKARRRNLPKQELDKLREKERIAKRKQRARSKKASSRRGSLDCSSDALEEATRPKEITDGKCNITSTITSDETAENSNEVPGKVENNCNGDKYNETSEARKKVLNRIYDRSLLSAEELEILRKREREYQRKRRARLRDQKRKASGQLNPSSKKSFQTNNQTSEDVTAFEQAWKKPETRSSNGISCPTQRYLECDPDEEFGFKEDKSQELKLKRTDSQEANLLEVTPWKEQGRDNETKTIMDSVKPKEEVREDDSTSPVSLNAKPTFLSDAPCDKQQNDFVSPEYPKITSHSVPMSSCYSEPITTKYSSHITSNFSGPIMSSYFPEERERRSPFIEALFASDYQRKESNGFYHLPEPSFEYCPKYAHSKFERPWPENRINAISNLASSLLFNEKYCQGKSLQNHFGVEEMTGSGGEGKRKYQRNRKLEQSESQKWRHWKSGLSDDQLQRRRLSNREAQRRRRMRLKMMQMSSQHGGIRENMMQENAAFKEQPVDDLSERYSSIKSFNVPKTRLESILEKREKVFIDAQMEKCRVKNEEANSTAPPNSAKSRGCRVKVTPQRQVVVPTMSYLDVFDDSMKKDYSEEDFGGAFDDSKMSAFKYLSNLSSVKNQEAEKDLEQSPTQDEPVFSTSSRKRKQFCPRRLLSEAEKRSAGSMQRLAIAQF